MRTFTAALVLLFAVPGEPPQYPAPGLAIPCRVERIVDGDTLEVSVTHRLRVRLLDCWAPELREPGGRESRDHLASLAEQHRGDRMLLEVPFGERLDQSFSFGRVLGRVWVVAEQPLELGAAQVTAGHATATKGQVLREKAR